jgi:hypothetical protein
LCDWVQLDPEQDLVDLPEMVQGYHSLFPLEDVNREDDVPSTSFGVRTMIFKGISSSDGQAYAIRRIDSRQVVKAFTHMHMRLIVCMPIHITSGLGSPRIITIHQMVMGKNYLSPSDM